MNSTKSTAGLDIVVLIVVLLLTMVPVSFVKVAFAVLLMSVPFVTLMVNTVMLINTLVFAVRFPIIHVLFVPESGAGDDVK